MRKRADEVAQLAGMDPEVRGQRLADEVAMIWAELTSIKKELEDLIRDYENHNHKIVSRNPLYDC